jgi:UDP-3-O-[3-hydroxymyristoyl] N-acetylglucosamine deacetylase
VFPRRSLRCWVELTGLGVRSGQAITVRIGPAPEGAGLHLGREDTGERWPLHLEAALALPGCSAVGEAESSVAYVEHLMAAFAAAGVTDAEVTVGGPELPLLDGSARPWLDLLDQAGIVDGQRTQAPLTLSAPLVVHEDTCCLTALPADQPRFTYLLDHPHPLIGRQWADFCPDLADFRREIAPAPTFTTLEEVTHAQELGFLPGGSAENALIVYPDHLSREPLWPNVFARHKLLDLLGDLYLLNVPVCAHVIAHNSGHRQNLRLARALWEQAPGGAS